MTYRAIAALLLASIFTSSIVASARGGVSGSDDASTPSEGPVLEPPTLHSIGVHWVIGGDENQNAEVRVAYRTPGEKWKNAMPLFRVVRGAHRPKEWRASVEVPDKAWLFAGSLLMLTPDTEYEVKLSLVDPDGGNKEALLKTRTMVEPTAPANAAVFHVIPGNGGGSGSAADPFRGIDAAQHQAQPSTVFLLHAGSYPAPVWITKSGEPGRPIIWQGAGDGEAIIDGGAERDGRLLSADNAHDVWFEDLTIRNGGKGIAGQGSARIVVRRCHIQAVTYGIFATRNEDDSMRGWFVADNVIEGPSTWPRTKGIEDARGIQLTGEGHVVCFNRIRGFADAIDTFPSVRCASIDFHNNDISEMTDDGVELDYSERNLRCFLNRFTNVFQGISVQPVYGGPVYVFRNALYNIVVEPFKMHSGPSGALFFHNTVVKRGMPLLLYTGDPVHHCQTRNNLFIGTQADFAYESTAKMVACDFDYDGVGGGPWTMFLKWNGVRYASLAEVQQKGPIWRHSVVVDPATAFAGGTLPPKNEKEVLQPADLQLKAGTAAIDTGELLPGINDDFTGKAPDLGAYEFGAPPPHYGPRSP